MTPETLERLAREAIGPDEVLALCALVRAQALEEAAQACDRRVMGDLNREDMEARACAAAIRALGETK